MLLTGTIQLSFNHVLEGVRMASRLRDEGMGVLPRPFFSRMGTKVESCRWRSPEGSGGASSGGGSALRMQGSG